MNLKRLEQITIEDKYSRHDKRAIILRDIKEGLPQLLMSAMACLAEYFSKTYSYGSKNYRIAYYLDNTDMSYEELITEVLLITLPIQSPKSIQSVVGKLADIMGYDEIFDGIRTASEVVVVLAGAGFYSIIAARDSESGSIMLKSNYSLEEESLQRLADMKYLPPMVCKPDKVWANNHGGYLTKDDSVILGANNHHDEKLNLSAINHAASIKLSLDVRILNLIEQPKADDPEDSQQEIEEKHANHRRMVTTSKVVYQELLDSGNEFYLTWKFDKRGRMYSQGYHVNIQSTSYKKALINLATPQIIQGV